MIELSAGSFTALIYFVLVGLVVAIVWLLWANIADARSKRREKNRKE